MTEQEKATRKMGTCLRRAVGEIQEACTLARAAGADTGAISELYRAMTIVREVNPRPHGRAPE